ncbi:hypothetical protein MtrunA17_Chr4g0061551 [Medicago truncatula]|uniref:Uncharacterized protein n=1 Tax=Medicago truncatula TaxID=3880 RepID=A0A396ILF5_MEDTR|nr:hypothetical protein MtrunA17_Chr4g0061551 [Medicago truncatula]
MAKSASSLLQKLKSFIKAPWEITGPVSHPEFKSALPGALDYRPYCPATTKEKAIIPTSDPETVYDIKYYTRDQRRNRPPIVRTIYKKADIEKLKKEATYNVEDFPPIYPNIIVEEDMNARGGGLCYHGITLITQSNFCLCQWEGLKSLSTDL